VVIVALVAGWGLYRLVRAPRATPANVFTGGDPFPAGDSVGAADFADIAESTLAPVCQAVDPDPIYLSIWHELSNLAGGLNRALLPVENRPLVVVVVLVAVVVCVSALVG
jgi:hypothetical protein